MLEGHTGWMLGNESVLARRGAASAHIHWTQIEFEHLRNVDCIHHWCTFASVWNQVAKQRRPSKGDKWKNGDMLEG